MEPKDPDNLEYLPYCAECDVKIIAERYIIRLYHSKSGHFCPDFEWQISLDRFIYKNVFFFEYKMV